MTNAMDEGERLAWLRGRRRERQRQRRWELHRRWSYMSLFGPLGLAFMFFYVIFGRVVLNFAIKTGRPNAVTVDIDTSGVALPSSTSRLEPPMIVTTIEVSTEEVRLDGNRVGTLGDFAEADDEGWDELSRRLLAAADHQKRVERFNPYARFRGNVMVVADRTTPYRILDPIIRTAREAGYPRLKLAVSRADPSYSCRATDQAPIVECD